MSLKKLPRIAIGTYRLFLGMPEHERALFSALKRQSDERLNLSLIDTSSSYGNGLSERLIGKVLHHENPEILRREEVYLTSKFGYLQGESMRQLQEGKLKLDEATIIKPFQSIYHCIHPEFMRDQLSRSLTRLQTDYVDSYLICNPEYYLMHHIQSSDVNVRELQANLLARIAETFEALEGEIKKGTIKSYGISSNSFALPPEHPHFLPYKDLTKLAEEAASKSRGTKDHGFSTVQFPANVLETEGLKSMLTWASKQNLQIMTSRPLSSFDQTGIWKIVSTPRTSYQEVLAETLEHIQKNTVSSDNKPHFLVETINRLNSEIQNIDSVFRYEEIKQRVYSLIHKKFDEIPHEWLEHLQKFFNEYEREVQHIGSVCLKKYLDARGIEVGEGEGNFEEFAVQFLLEHEKITSVILEVGTEKHVNFARKMLKIDLEDD
ncbi:Aldo/keto reductase [Basidiobolus meristosporus CBS 931.73]|uniref:Aldo/keto reductase n=1 Tax=Basidiobolus meristosporus CBS 931.73 TaxID=1314790 RepID=A0A1Y1Z934_9FUNG|nr:Aldo/keto reductase [Basidiobolus meristosporus CBS 931.73]|eukprot:ORY06624.1 Aldo/keto reductase [Basidiobolus meristosporus CBS 931.73]